MAVDSNGNPIQDPGGFVQPRDTYVPVGQTPLTGLPQYSENRNDYTQNEKFYAADQFVKLFGRNPTQAELDSLSQKYDAGNRIDINKNAGDAAVSDYFNQQSQTPQALFNQQSQAGQKAYTTNKGKIDPQINQVFQSQLGRDATSDELQHFGTLVATGQDPYQVQQALQQSTEYQNRATSDFTQRLGTQLQGTNADYFSKFIAPQLQAQAANSGRSTDSSGVNAQLANAAQGQNYDLQNYLAGIQANQYGQSTANAAGNYQQLLGQQYGLQNAGVSNALSNQASNQQYNQNLAMYQMQQTAYNSYLNNYGKRNGAVAGFTGALKGGISGAVAGGTAGGPWGALAGGLGGAAAGGASGAFI